MDESLRYLLAIVEHGNLSKAARGLFISQPALSRYVSRLESTLGTKIIERSSRPLALTPAGQRYCAYLQSVERLRAALETDLESLGQGEWDSVRLGITSWRSSALLPEVLPDVLMRLPELKITLLEGSNSQLHAGLRSKKLDLAVMNSFHEGLGMHFEAVTTERIALVGRDLPGVISQSNGSPDASHLDPTLVKVALQRSRLLLLHPEHHLGAISRDFLTSLGVHNARVIETQNIMTAIRLASRGVGLAFAPEGAVYSAESNGAPYVHIRHPGLVREVGLAWPLGVEPTASVLALAQAFRVQLASHELDRADPSPP